MHQPFPRFNHFSSWRVLRSVSTCAYFSRLNGRKWQMIPTVTNVAETGSMTIFYPDKALMGFFISVWDIVSRRHAKLLEHDQARCISRVALQAGFQVSDRLVGIPQCVIR